MTKLPHFYAPLLAAGVLLGSLAHAAPDQHAAPARPADPIVTELMTRALPQAAGKEAMMILVDYPPGAADPIHRHDASAFVYVLEGSIVMQVQGGQEVTLTPGQTFYEGPEDVHTVGRNASKTQPARFLAVLIKKQGAPALIPTN
ncbi:cupin [Bordetella pseudohinzii]|uniref:Cupin n=1 Tax=Bordetella pseudohinzii TaxID=1331258 RepID=A0A0J6C4T0_9BORD|nr:cupin domain-containing protein [Bordetella pseudohinzii]ANY17524.1 cupin [Bordetella pseudohinzii]KMM25751.1 cupin [Bordetella pseudohinzii]KXA81741.1 cupin [Bordetella pseudohinzii]KXA83020.1 cupin [Bordetella pseudohinzii]CUI73145.1 Cupin domain [Bordetella pseudohinzii]